jgi:tRNA(Arg) A34 adenosine deaminase TadA
MPDSIHTLLRTAIQAAQHAREQGNHPFGAVLVGPDGHILLTAENTVNIDQDVTAHAETNLVRIAAHHYDPAFLANCTLYASTEPCPMCAGAIYWGNIGRVVYGLSQEGLFELTGSDPADALLLSCREVFTHGGKSIEVIGPILEEEARGVHLGFWDHPDA